MQVVHAFQSATDIVLDNISNATCCHSNFGFNSQHIRSLTPQSGASTEVMNGISLDTTWVIADNGINNVMCQTRGTDVPSGASGTASTVQSQSLRRQQQRKFRRRMIQRQTVAVNPAPLSSVATVLPW